MPKSSPARLAANARYDETQDRIVFRTKKGGKDRYKKIAEANNKSLSTMIVEALEEYINNHKL